MTDVLEPTDRAGRSAGRGDHRGVTPAAEPVPDRALVASERRVTMEGERLVSWVAAAANVGAGLIHFAYAQEHLSEEASHGAFFLVAGWSQLALAFALGVRAAPRRAWAAVCVAVNGGIIGVWLASRTVGVPGSDPESVGLADIASTALEALAVLAALVLVLGTVARARIARPGFGALGVAGLLLGGLVTASVTPAIAGGHGHSAGGHDEGPGAEAAHGHGGATADADWQETRLAALYGYQDEATILDFRQANIDYVTERIETIQADFLATLPPEEAERRVGEFVEWSVDNALQGENGASQGNEMAMHSHGPSEWVPIESAEDQAALQAQLQEAGEVIGEFPTAADAVAGGYMQVTPYVPGIGAHYLSIPRLTDGEFVPGEPEMLLYNGNEPTSELVGLSYGMWGEQPPEGFVGPNDTWHTHPSLCTVGGTFVVGPDHTTPEMCASIGGEKGNGGRMHMTHLWQVPGWESSWGLFSGENPRVNLVTTDFNK